MRTFVAGGIVLASSLLATGSATAQNPVYGTPSLLPPSNTTEGVPVNSAARMLPPVPRTATSPWNTQTTAYGRQNDNVPVDNTESSDQPSVLSDSLRGAPAPSMTNSPSDSCAPGRCVDNSILPSDSGYGNGYTGGSSGYGCGANVSSTSTYPAGTVCGASRGWYAGVGGLIMTRDNENHKLFSYDDANESVQLTDSRDASQSWAGGFETWIGHYFNCGMCAFEVGYWGLFPGQSGTMTTAADVVGNLNGINNWDSITYDGNTGDTYVNNAAAHRIVRDFEYQNIELNVLNFSNSCNPGLLGRPAMSWNWLAGVRYFRFKEFMEFGSDPNDTVFDGEDDELYYRIRTDNNLVGAQLGGNGRYCLSQRLGLISGLKVGLYNNHINSRSVIGGAAGTATINNGPFNGAVWDISSTKDDIAFLSELNLGLNFMHNNNWSSYAGYRAIAVTGVALPTNQIYPDLRGINDVAVIQSNGSLILHGVFAGVTYCF